MSNQAVERFERELTQQIGGLRAEVRQVVTSLRAEMREGDAALRLEMRDGDAAIRLEMRDVGVSIVREIAMLRQEMADQRAELFKWSFAFWFGQFAAVGGLMALLLRRLPS